MRLVWVELCKLLRLPSARAGVALGVLCAPAIAAVSAPSERSAAVDVAFLELTFGVIGAILLGVVAVSSEYRDDGEDSASTRQIVASLTAVPSRMRFLAAKAAALSLTVATTAMLATVIMLTMLAGTGEDLGPGVVGRGVGLIVYWVLTALIAFGITLLTRNGVVPLVVLLLNSSVISFTYLLSRVVPAANYFPDLAGPHMFLRRSPTGVEIGPVTGGLVMLGWTVVLLAVGAFRFQRSDA
ncbi:hypothetical protein [Winogradskya humida]|uniref:hypothetical protein n=1 Tax=Winogradskya humida TaxID=113566 RepID=UPI001944068C|nr:hypothetical protein [Actinoplanes humidus]